MLVRVIIFQMDAHFAHILLQNCNNPHSRRLCQLPRCSLLMHPAFLPRFCPKFVSEFFCPLSTYMIKQVTNCVGHVAHSVMNSQISCSYSLAESILSPKLSAMLLICFHYLPICRTYLTVLDLPSEKLVKMIPWRLGWYTNEPEYIFLKRPYRKERRSKTDAPEHQRHVF